MQPLIQGSFCISCLPANKNELNEAISGSIEKTHYKDGSPEALQYSREINGL